MSIFCSPYLYISAVFDSLSINVIAIINKNITVASTAKSIFIESPTPDIHFTILLSAIGSIIAAAHPLTILVSFIGAPITSLCPFVGVGFLTGITQAFVCKPKVKDIEDLSTDAGSLKGFYKNRVLKVLLVFILSSLGSSIGTFVSGADIISKLSSIITITN